MAASEKTVKQVIVMRNDLNMRKGKMIAQGSHASIAFLTNKLKWDESDTQQGDNYWNVTLSDAEDSWIEGRFTKICVRVNSEEELLEIHAKATEAGIVSHLIQDAGLTEFKDSAGNPVPTYTCAGLGPDYAERIDLITGHLELL